MPPQTPQLFLPQLLLLPLTQHQRRKPPHEELVRLHPLEALFSLMLQPPDPPRMPPPYS